MLSKTCLAQTLRSSIFRATSSSLHTSSPILVAENHRKRQARTSKKVNTQKDKERQIHAETNRPHVVLGTRPGEDAKWLNCDLSKVLVDEEDLMANTKMQPLVRPSGEIYLPKYLGFGVGDAEKKMLFENLPTLSAEAGVSLKARGNPTPLKLSEYMETMEKRELDKANAFARVLDLRNANAGGIAYENRRRIITEFSESENPFDTGRPEVQAALLTFKIRNLWTHLIKFKRDIVNRRSLRKLIHERAKILKYLKRLDRDRYDNVLERLALAPESVEGELVI